MNLDRVTRGGLDAVRLSNGSVELEVATAVGPRIVAFAFVGGPNFFAELGDAGLNLPGGGRFTFHGGHRLWVAPEEPDRTYEPDDLPVEIAETATGLVVSQPKPSSTGLHKSMEITFTDEALVEISHTITNRSAEPVQLAPWAITQLAPGGIGILPYAAGGQGESGLQPNSLLVGWPYTDFAELRIGRDLAVVETDRRDPIKIGTDLRRGWLAYATGNRMFAKHARHQVGARYTDRGASAQIYCNHRFLELETLGPLVTLPPGEHSTHVEAWSLHQQDEPFEPGAIADLMDRAGGTPPRALRVSCTGPRHEVVE